jgi:predicted nuclease of predicted toxin-antitoxin system
MKFFLDENFPKTAFDVLLRFGHEAIDIRGTQNEGAEDITIFDLAQEQQATFLTTDRDFFHTVPHLYKHHFGVVVIALRQPNRHNILGRLEWFLDNFGDTSLENRIFQLRDQTYVTYPA